MNEIEIIDVVPSNVFEYGFFCGIKNLKHEGYQRKLDWLKNAFLKV